MKYSNSELWFNTRALTTLMISLLLIPQAFSQDIEQTSAPTSEVNAEDVQSRLDRLKENATLDETVKARATELYTQALDQLAIAKTHQQNAEKFEADRISAPESLRKIEEELAKPLDETVPTPPEDATANELNQLSLQKEAELAEADKLRNTLAAEPARRAERRAQIPTLIPEITKRIQDAEAQLALPPDTTQPPEIVEAQRTSVRARLQAATAERDLLEKEQRSYEARTQLLTKRRDQAERNYNRLQRVVNQWRTLVAEAREREAEIAAEAANQISTRIENLPPAQKEIASQVAEFNVELVQERNGENGVLTKIQEAQNVLDKLTAQSKSVQSDYDAITEKAKTQKLLDVWGTTLRKYRRLLREYMAYPTDIQGHNKAMGDIFYRLFEIDQERRGLYDIEERVNEILESLALQEEEPDNETLKEVLLELYTTQRDTLDALKSDYNTYTDKLTLLLIEEDKYLTLTDNFQGYIEENILWVRSAEPVSLNSILDIPMGFQWCINPDNWARVLQMLRRDAIRAPWLNAAFLIVLAVIVFLRRRWVRQIKEAAAPAMKPSATDFILTFKTFLSTLGVALIVPGALGFVVWRLRISSYSEDFVHGVSSGIGHVALLLITIESLRQTLRKEGLGEAHFNWPNSTLKAVRKSILRFAPFILISAFIFSLCEWSTDTQVNHGLGRLAFLVGALATVLLGHRLLRPKNGPLASLLGRRMGKHKKPLYLLYLIILALPITLGVLSLIGYHYTAMRLAWRLHGTILIAFAVFVAHGLFSRWLLTTRRRLAKEHAQQRREVLKQQAKDGVEVPKDKFETEELNLAKIDARTQNLLRGFAVLALIVGVWLVWNDVLPALRAFNSYELWETTSKVSVVVGTGEGGVPLTQIEERPVPITPIHLGKALVIAIITWMLARNLPVLIELALLRKLALAPGERYAIQTVLGYCIAAVGIIMVPSVLGLGWSKLQWLVASLGVGLGFGLQEIFANFVSGLIILFERPIRVGDTVTIGGISGQVTRIRIRATRILDWDRKELIVPNKEFVTGQLINWSLSDTTTRLTIPVGIAYGSDTEKAIRVLLETAEAHPLILDDPEPDVLFISFGESTLDFELRVFCPTLETRMKILHEMHLAIDKEFRAAGIEIAFPQRDVHLYNMQQSKTESPDTP